MPSYQLEISVTEKCNLGCPYCYVANVDKFMTPEIFDKAWPEFLQLIEKSKAHGQQFHLSFFGGEPLLNVPLMDHVCKKVKVPEYEDRLVGLTMISNLSLINEEIADWILENQIGCSWSFDGISANESRPIIKKLKNYFNRPRPKKLAKNFGIQLKDIELESMKTPSYPSGQSTQGYLVAEMLKDKYPKKAKELDKKAKDISESRNIARAHYKSDSELGKKLGLDMAKHLKGNV